jgi:hypothetical protein
MTTKTSRKESTGPKSRGALVKAGSMRGAGMLATVTCVLECSGRSLYYNIMTRDGPEAVIVLVRGSVYHDTVVRVVGCDRVRGRTYNRASCSEDLYNRFFLRGRCFSESIIIII